MDPNVERRLRDEVLYLHSLWRRGPTVTYSPHPTPLTAPHIAIRSVSEQPQTIKNHKKKQMTQMDESTSEDKRQKVSDSVWTCTDRPPMVDSGTEWPAFKAQLDQGLELTLEEKATMSARRVQQIGVEASRKFFSGDAGSSDGEFESEDDSESESETEGKEIDESREFQFFNKLFQDDEELREFYLKNGSGGVFCCLVCRGNGEKVTKKFRNCVALVQHSVTISSTHKRKAHRAYGQVICNILNWDINKLPADTLPDQGGLKLAESESGDVVVPQDLGATTGTWDVKWTLNKKPAFMSHWGQVLNELDLVSNRELTEEEKIKAAAAKLQERSREAARAFFSRDEFLDSDDEIGDEISLDGIECEEYKFLVKLFEEDQELMDYYKKSWGSGAFSCLVCWGSVEKLNKRYNDCVGLVQHCVSISKTKRKVAHRAYGKIICELLSWDINKLPASKLSTSDVIGTNSMDSHGNLPSLEKSAENVSEQHAEPLEKYSEKKAWQPEKTINDSSCKKSYQHPKEPNTNCIVDQQLNGSVKSVSTNELGWVPFNLCTSQSLSKELTVAEEMKSTSIKVHKKCLDATRAFFSRDRGSDSDDDSQEEEEEDEEEEETTEQDDLNTFFMCLLEGGELMGYYQKNWENGEFLCLVCGASGEQLTKRFKNLVAVVQHCVTVSKSKRIRAHRVYGEVICKSLNWDIKRLPVISPPDEDNLCPTSANSHSQVNAIVNCGNKNAS